MSGTNLELLCLRYFLEEKGKKMVIRMAILLPVRAESALTLPAATPPIPACKRAHGTGTATPLAAPAVLAGDHPQPPQQPAQGFPLGAQKHIRITVFHTPIDLRVPQCRTLGFVCSLAG